MTPDKVEAALELLQWLASDLPPTGHRKAVSEALAALTSALADRERDAARYRWLRDSSGLVAGIYGGIGLAIGSWSKDDDSKRDLDTAIDAAMKDTDHAR